MLLDLHCHTKYSRDNTLDPAAFVHLAKARGLDGVCVTEHNSVEASAPVVRLGREEGLVVLQAVEVTTDIGHVLCFGFADDTWRRLRRGYYTPVLALSEFAAEAGAVLVPAHPFREWSDNAARDEVYTMEYITAVEVVNGVNSPAENAGAHRAAKALGLPGTGGSDSHFEDEVARVATEFPESIADMADLVAALRGQAYFPVVRDHTTGAFAPPVAA